MKKTSALTPVVDADRYRKTGRLDGIFLDPLSVIMAITISLYLRDVIYLLRHYYIVNWKCKKDDYLKFYMMILQIYLIFLEFITL